MNKQEIIGKLNENYNSFIEFVNSLSEDEFVLNQNEKWTAGQQLGHIVLSVKAILQVFSMDQSMIDQNFGSTDRLSLTYEVLLHNYLEKLEAGGKAPERYLPQPVLQEQKQSLVENLEKMILSLASKIENFTEQDLDRLQIPHPLLGNLTMREMLYNVIYHVEHHHQATKQNLTNTTAQ